MEKPDAKKGIKPNQDSTFKEASDAGKSRITGTELPEGANIDKIRDILFGAQKREFDKRLARLEERVVKEATDLRDEIRRRFDSIENYAKKEIESLGERLKTEQQERNQALKEAAREVKDHVNVLDKKISQLDEQTSKKLRELRQQLLDQSKELTDELRQKHQSLSDLLDKEVSDLRLEKTDRVALANLLTEVSLRLTNDLKLPGSD
jgi:DNA repair exonuclease SbcCD ATPase subunit